ncbi:N-6 DNA methylase [Clostridium sp.]|uniref:Eco57I restriction-modification methylase domain-containing protein n=1 Tax=Clostridium sp. TaxID=1506 RepID=UPI003464023D
MNKFDKIIEECFNKIYLSTHSINICSEIDECKKKLSMEYEDSFRDFYNNMIKNQKEKGAVYTPRNIVNYMIQDLIKEYMIVDNPFIKILDPSCGGGNFLIELYNYLKDIYMKNLENINTIHGLKLQKSTVYKHIMENNLYGFDIDETALKILRLDMWNIIKAKDFRDNIKVKDFLTTEEEEEFHIIIGNPPYIGHKSIDKDYVKKIKNMYKEVYVNKSDICYCFINRAKDFIKKDGKVALILSRYLMESQSAKGIRNFIEDNYTVEKIVDFYGIRPFKGNGIDPLILFLSYNHKEEYKFKVIRPRLNQIRKRDFNFIDEILREKDLNVVLSSKEDLHQCFWRILNPIEKSIVRKIEDKSNCSLKDIGENFQGIITGCDKAFIVTASEIKKYKIETDILKPWIKSSNICNGEMINTDKWLIYSNDIDINIHKNALKYIENYYSKLKNRRECKRNIRKWYELQWGRSKKLFDEEKIIYPYKASENRFVSDKSGCYFSADVYGFTITDSSVNSLFITNLLNSRLYEFYVKCNLKKLGDYLYEYYPNRLLTIKIFKNHDYILEENFKEEDIYKFYDITLEEIAFIEDKLSRD